MEPAFERGDLLFLWNRGLDTQVGEIVVYNVRGKDIPIVHRVIRRFGGGYAHSLYEYSRYSYADPQIEPHRYNS